MKMILSLVLLSSIFSAQAFAFSSERADERINNPQAFRLGDSDDLQADQLRVDQMKVCSDDSVVKSVEVNVIKSDSSKVLIQQKRNMQKRLIKNSYI